MLTTLDVLEGAKKNLQVGWCRGAYHKYTGGADFGADSAICAYCLKGALHKSVPSDELLTNNGPGLAARLLLEELLRPFEHRRRGVDLLVYWNDNHADQDSAIALIDEAIRVHRERLKAPVAAN